MNEICTIIISTFFSIIASIIVSRIELKRNLKKEKNMEYYIRFNSLWDKIHQGRAFDFSDLKYNQQEEIISFFIETDRYQSKEIKELIYELKTGRLNNFENNSISNIDTCNKAYRILTEKIITKYNKICKRFF